MRQMVSAVMLLTALLAACMVLGASALSGAAHAASTSAPECIAGTGAPLPPALAAAGAAGCHGYTAPSPTNAPTPLALEPGALPVVQALPGASAADLSAGLAPLVQTPSSRESFYWYSLFATKTEPQENCWQTGVLGASSYACDSVGASYLPSGPHMHEVSEQGVGEDFQISPSGDYCNYYRLGEGLNTTNGNKQSGNTGYEPPAPLGSYQEGNSHISPPNVCQAYETFWGQVLQGSGNSKCETRPPCGMQHYVSLHEQGGNDRPWGNSFGEPSLIISDDVLPYSLGTLGTHAGAWGYLCPLFEDQTTGDILESCIEEWRIGSGYPSTNEHFDVVSACASPGSPPHNLDQTITQFASGTSFAENNGSQKTFAFEPKETKKEWRDFSARITKANLENAITADRRNHPFNEKEREEAEQGKRSWYEQGCGRSLSTNPANYALIGIEQGVEGGSLSEIGASDANLQLWTEYTPLPPEATTNAASGVQQTQATLNGTVNPKGTDTHYYFQYGKTTEYGSSTPSTDAGSGTTSLPEGATVTGLQPGTTYHYRLVATSVGGTAYGSDQTFTAFVGLSPVVVRNPTNGNQWVYYQGANGQIYQWVDNGSSWLNVELLGEAAAPGSSPTVVRDETTGNQWVYYQGANGQIYQWVYNGSSWLNVELLGEAAAPGSSPTVVRNPTNGDQWVYYQGANGQMYQWLDNVLEWKNYGIGGEAFAPGSSPMAVRNPTNGEQWVYYQGANSQIYQWVDNGSKWLNVELLGEGSAPGSSPMAVRNPTNGEQWVYYQGANGQMYQWLDNVLEWKNYELNGNGEVLAPGSSPMAVRNPTNGEQWVYYQGANGQIYQWVDNGSKWLNVELLGEASAPGSSPTVVRDETAGDQWVYYQGANGQMYQWLDNVLEWKNYGIGGGEPF